MTTTNATMRRRGECLGQQAARRGLSPTEKVVLAFIESRDGDDVPSRAEIRRAVCVNDTALGRAMSTLRDAGLIPRGRNPGGLGRENEPPDDERERIRAEVAARRAVKRDAPPEPVDLPRYRYCRWVSFARGEPRL